MTSLFKAGGWSVCYHPIQDELYIYRADRPGDIILTRSDAGYTCEMYAHSEKLVASMGALFADLECDEKSNWLPD